MASLYLHLPALGIALCGQTHGQGGFVATQAAHGWVIQAGLLLILGGALTAIPLIAYADAVRRIPFSIVGLVQYIAPTLQLACGVLVFGEPFGRERLLGFDLIWIALAIFATDGLLRSRRQTAVLPA